MRPDRYAAFFECDSDDVYDAGFGARPSEALSNFTTDGDVSSRIADDGLQTGDEFDVVVCEVMWEDEPGFHDRTDDPHGDVSWITVKQVGSARARVLGEGLEYITAHIKG